MQFLPSEPAASLDETRQRVRRHIERQREFGLSLWAVEERETGDVLGLCGLFPVGGTGPDIEVAYHISRRHWNRGLATEAARACVEAGLAAGLQEILAFALPENAASLRVMEKIGMRPYGRVRLYGTELALVEALRERLTQVLAGDAQLVARPPRDLHHTTSPACTASAWR
jgi:ribosomal-protein-alanine N-acetyltransferase